MSTRFNPTLSGDLHIGHVYIMLLNRYLASITCGDFIVRFSYPPTRTKLSRYCPFGRIFRTPHAFGRTLRSGDIVDYESIRKNICDNIDFLGIPVDKYSEDIYDERCSKYQAYQESSIAKSFKFRQAVGPESVFGEQYFPYIPYTTCCKVLQDYQENCTCFIRGEDLLTEYSLYCYFCDVFSIPYPRQFFVPKLLGVDNENICTSGPNGGKYSINNFIKKGYTRDDIMILLCKSCLLNENGFFEIDNLVKNPVLRYF